MNVELYQLLGLGVAAITASVGLGTYQKNSRTKAAEFLLSLHKSFFIDPTYTAMKALLDCDGAEEEARLQVAVETEASEFTDFLNLFELIAYLTEIGTLEHSDTEALLGYYLDRLQDKAVVWSYIKNSTKSFENLRRLLAERRPQ